MTAWRHVNVVVWMSLVLACGGSDGTSTDDVEATTGDETASSPVEMPEPTDWADMDRPARLAFMQQQVMPELKSMFQEFDGERFAEFNCATCHGENMQEVDFAMPNGIAPLNPAHVPSMFQSEQPMAQFMVQRVWPRMTEMLGAEPYNPETQEGFGCFSCHGMAEN